MIKREWWKRWEHENVPGLEYIIQSYDTAFSAKETADYSAITTWGVFKPNEDQSFHIILLDSIKGRWEFPELKRVAHEQYKHWDPDNVVIEAKASGLPLTYELRQTGIPVTTYTPTRGNDKVTRVNAVAPLVESGMVWVPEKSFANELIEECAAFPLGEHDDLVDSTVQALLRFRQGGFVSHPDDYDDKTPRSYMRPREYY